MFSYTYKWFHIPTKRCGEKTINSLLTNKEFLSLIEKWNNNLPELWLYAPLNHQ